MVTAMDSEQLDARPTLRAWLGEYDAIEADYLNDLIEQGIELGPRNAHTAESEQVKRRLRDKGALFRNGDASISVGSLSSACVACTGDCGSKTFFLSLECNRSCYFCFNANQLDFEQHQKLNTSWQREVEAFAEACECVTHVGLTGGEPLLHKPETLKFFEHIRSEHPCAHMRIYTAGDFFDESFLEALRKSGLHELRMSIKLDADDGDAIVDDAIEKLALAKRFIPDVMVEMPVIPGTNVQMKRLLRKLDALGVFGINLLEFCYPMGAWDEFGARGFRVKNPPFPVLYNYRYAGGLPIDGSELLCLELLEFGIDEGLSLGIHYCSLENKNCDQVLQQNTAYKLDAELFELSDADYFYRIAKVFDGDVPLVQAHLTSIDARFIADEQEAILSFHPRHVPALAELPVVTATSINVVEQLPDGFGVRELKLELPEGDIHMSEHTLGQTRAAAWEFAAFSFAYPTPELAEALASGEWTEAAAEIAEALNLPTPPDSAALASYVGLSPEDTLHTLRVEATRLFIGLPEPVTSPYEGVWRAAEDGVQALLFVNPHSMAVERAMKAVGVGQRKGINEPLDRVDAECAFLQYLCMLSSGMGEAPENIEIPEGGWAAEHDRFLEEHVRTWMPQFADRVIAESREPFYAAAATMLKQLTS